MWTGMTAFVRGGELVFDVVRVEVQGVVDVRHDGDAAHFEDRLVGGHEREGRADHLVPGPHVKGGEGDLEGRRTRGHPEGVVRPAVLREGLLEIADLPDPLPLLVESVAGKDARPEDIHDLLDLFLADQFRTSHNRITSFIAPSDGIGKI